LPFPALRYARACRLHSPRSTGLVAFETVALRASVLLPIYLHYRYCDRRAFEGKTPRFAFPSPRFRFACAVLTHLVTHCITVADFPRDICRCVTTLSILGYTISVICFQRSIIVYLPSSLQFSHYIPECMVMRPTLPHPVELLPAHGSITDCP